MKRLVCDTNVLLSGLLWRGPPRRLLAEVESGRFSLFTSRDLLEELARVLGYPRMRKPLREAGLVEGDILRWMVGRATLVVPKPLGAIAVAEDPSDDAVLACAASAAVDAVVSGDAHLLALKAFHGIPVVSASDFMRSHALHGR
ncbi:MAG: putative toxin-antitoxin system toxin component, PIN family [Planctomycetota bacterium]